LEEYYDINKDEERKNEETWEVITEEIFGVYIDFPNIGVGDGDDV
jgi:hypothetical protein